MAVIRGSVVLENVDERLWLHSKQYYLHYNDASNNIRIFIFNEQDDADFFPRCVMTVKTTNGNCHGPATQQSPFFTIVVTLIIIN